MIDRGRAAGEQIAEKYAAEQRQRRREHDSSRPSFAARERPEDDVEREDRRAEVLARLPDHVEVLVSRRTGLVQVELRGKRRPEGTEHVDDGERGDGEAAHGLASMAPCLLDRVVMLRKCVVAFCILATFACSRPNPRGPDVYGYRVQQAVEDPVVIERSPRTYYRGAWAHLVDGRWHYPTESGWVIFVDVPPELQRHTDSIDTEQAATDLPSPRGPTIHQLPGAGGPFATPPPRVR